MFVPQIYHTRNENDTTLGKALMMETFNCQDIGNKERCSDLKIH